LAYYQDEVGDIQMRKSKYDSSLKSLLSSVMLSRQYQLEELEPKTLTKIAMVHLQQKEYDKSYAYYDSTFSLYSKTKNQFGLAQVDLGRGIVHLDQQAYDVAKELIEKSLAVAHKTNARILEIDCYKNLYVIAEEQEEFKEALNYFKQFKALEDSLFSQEMVQKLYRDQIRFETESRDSRIAALSGLEVKQKEALKREEFIRNILVVVFALSVILLFTVYRSGQRRKEINKLLLRHQEDMEKRSEELERLNQVKDKFFSIISHDLRSPINALSGILDIMSKGGLSQEDFAKETEELRLRFNNTRTLLNNLLDWTLLQMDKLSLQPAKIILRNNVDDNIQLLTSLQAKHIKLINLVPEHAIGYADSNTVNLVVRNLMTNAIKFTNDGGEVTVSAKEGEKDWMIAVHDNGIGIKPEVQHILFDKTSPYTTRGTANEKGTGLGLILCKEFVEKNGGRIWVESTEGNGSTFWFTIPKPSETLVDKG
jgi:signal transduction histidine kinase